MREKVCSFLLVAKIRFVKKRVKFLSGPVDKNIRLLISHFQKKKIRRLERTSSRLTLTIKHNNMKTILMSL